MKRYDFRQDDITFAIEQVFYKEKATKFIVSRLDWSLLFAWYRASPLFKVEEIDNNNFAISFILGGRRVSIIPSDEMPDCNFDYS